MDSDLLVIRLLEFFVIFVHDFFGKKILEFGEDDSILAVPLARNRIVLHFSFRVHLHAQTYVEIAKRSKKAKTDTHTRTLTHTHTRTQVHNQ